MVTTNMADGYRPHDTRQLPPGHGNVIRRSFALFAVGNFVLAVALGVVGIGFGGFVVIDGDKSGTSLTIAGTVSFSNLLVAAIATLRVRSSIAGDRFQVSKVIGQARTVRYAYWITLIGGLVVTALGIALSLTGESPFSTLSLGLGVVTLIGALISVHSAYTRLNRLATTRWPFHRPQT